MSSVRFPSSRRRASSTINGSTVLVTLGVLLVLFVGVVVIPMTNYYELKDRVVTICKAERSATDSGGEYRVFTDTGTFSVKDASNFIIGRWRQNSSDVYGRLKEGKTYNITYYGWRLGFLSMTPNIWKVYNVADDQQNPKACD